MKYPITDRYIKLLASLLLLAACGPAFALPVLTFETRNSHYQVNGSESASDLLAAWNAATPVFSHQIDAFRDLDVSGYGGDNWDNAVLMTLSFNLDTTSDFQFQLGADFGRGGGVIVNGILDTLRTDDIWWAGDWNSGDVISTRHTLHSGINTLQWIGFEGCCDGLMSLRYSVDNSPWKIVERSDFTAQVPEPATLILFFAGLALIKLTGKQSGHRIARD